MDRLKNMHMIRGGVGALIIVALLGAGGLPSRPKFQAVGVNVVAGSTGSVTSQSEIITNSGGAVLNFTDGNAGTDETRWRIVGSDDDHFYFETLTDAGSAGTRFLDATRVGTAVTALTINGMPIGGAGSVFTAFAATGTTRASTTTATCDSELTITLPNVTARYALEAFVSFSGGGIAANGWKILPASAAGTVSITFWDGYAHTNTSVANAAPTANESSGVPAGFTAAFNTAGVPARVHVTGSITTSAGGSAPAICISWAQNASNATGTSLNGGSWLKATRLN